MPAPTDTERRLLKLSIDEWYDFLTKRFAQSAGTALATITSERYTLEDALRRREPRDYASIILRGARSAEMNNVYNQLFLLYNGLDPEFQRDVDQPTKDMTLDKFLHQLDKNKEIWFSLAARDQSRRSFARATPRNDREQQQQQRYPRNNFRREYGQYNSSSFRPYGGPRFPPRSPYSQPYQNTATYPNAYQNPVAKQYYSPYQNQAYMPNQQPQQSGQQVPSAPMPALPTPRQPLLLAGPAAGNRQPDARKESDSNRRFGNERSGRTFQPRTQRAYQASALDENEEEKSMIGNTNDVATSSFHESPSLSELDEAYYRGQSDAYAGGVFDEAEDPYEDVIDAGFVATAGRSKNPHQCRRCKKAFASKNKLHRHLPDCRDLGDGVNTISEEPKSVAHVHLSADAGAIPAVIHSDAKPVEGTGYAFRGWQYATVKASCDAAGPQEEICLDSGCTMSLGDRNFLRRMMPDFESKVKTMASPIPVRGVGKRIHHTDQFVVVEIYIHGTLPSGATATAKVQREIHVVEDLKVNVLVGIDILAPERMLVDLDARTVTIRTCGGLVAPITVVTRHNPITRRVVRARARTVVPPFSYLQIPVKIKDLPDDRDFIFEPEYDHDLGEKGGLYSHVVDAALSFVQLRNDTDQPVTIQRHARLGRVTEFNEDGCFLANPVDHHLALSRPTWKSRLFAGTAALASVFAGAADLSKVASPETTLASGVTVFGAPPVAARFAAVVEAFPDIWIDRGTTVDIPEESWMPITLKPEASSIKPSRVYPLSTKDKAVVDETFDKLHAQGKLHWTTQPTPFGYPVFVVWRDVNGDRKGRVVVDIRGLNKITLPDSYPMPLQSDIINSVAGCQYISVIDAQGYFHQWPVKSTDRSKLTVVSHRGQEEFSVAVMGFKNSPPYVQRQTDELLRPHRHYARAYMDDIVIFSQSLDEHLQHLYAVFQLFHSRHICLSPKKSYLGYPSVSLLGQRVSGFGMTTSEERIEAILALRFPENLSELDTYLGMTGYLRNYIRYYAQIVEPLQKRKTELAKAVPKGLGKSRKKHTLRVDLSPTEAELRAFKHLQDQFRKPSFLTHFNPALQLYVDLDASKVFGIGAMVYHIVDSKPAPIMFLSRGLNSAERNYWPTELEVAGLIWVMKQIRHLVESTKKPTVVFTDHSASVSISRQTTLSTSNTDKLNLRLVRASQYLSMFDLDIRYKPGKRNVVPDALSRLLRDRIETSELGDEEGILDALTTYVYAASLVEMSPDFRKRISEAVEADKRWKDVLAVARKSDSETTSKPPKSGRFEIIDDLLHHVGPDSKTRLVIPQAMEAEIFHLAHRPHHAGFHRTYQHVAESLYVRNLSKRLRKFIEHCPVCLLHQTRRHKPYGELQPIGSVNIPFHTVTMDFVLALPLTEEGLDCLLTITCKFSKRLNLIAGKTTYSAKEWALLVLERLQLSDWGIPSAIISDRDPKFLSEFWQAVFEKLGTSLLTSTAYHPQTDGQSERTNQTVEIALRFLLSSTDGTLWPTFLPALQAAFNNTDSVATGRSPNEIVYGFKTSEIPALILPTPNKPDLNVATERSIHRSEATDAVVFAAAKAKSWYDKRHTPLVLLEGSHAFLRLHRGYHLPGHPSRKLSQQYCGPFLVEKRVGKLAYKLKIPSHWRIHPVVSIAQLEPAPNGTDPYQRPTPDHPDSIFVEGDTAEWESSEIEKLVDRRVRRYGKGPLIKEYLVRWKGYGPEWDEWYGEDLLDNAMELVQAYEEKNPAGSSTEMGQKKRGRGRPRKDN